MQNIIYLLIGLIAGGILGYLLARLAIQANILRLTAEVNSRLTREEVAAGYVAVGSFKLVQGQLVESEKKKRSKQPRGRGSDGRESFSLYVEQVESGSGTVI